MADPVVLPRVRAAQPISDKEGRAASAFVIFWEKLCRQIEGLFRSIIDVNDRQDAADLALADVIDTIAGVLAGTIPFTELNVANTQYKSFLQKTDGSKLVNGAGIDGGLISTPKIALLAVTNIAIAQTAARFNITNPTSFTTVQNVSLPCTGGNVVLTGNFFLNASITAGAFQYTIVIERLIGATTTTIFSETHDSPPITGADYVVGKIPINWTDAPGTNTAAYYLRISFNQSGWDQLYFENTFFSAQEFKR